MTDKFDIGNLFIKQFPRFLDRYDFLLCNYIQNHVTKSFITRFTSDALTSLPKEKRIEILNNTFSNQNSFNNFSIKDLFSVVCEIDPSELQCLKTLLQQYIKQTHYCNHFELASLYMCCIEDFDTISDEDLSFILRYTCGGLIEFWYNIYGGRVYELLAKDAVKMYNVLGHIKDYYKKDEIILNVLKAIPSENISTLEPKYYNNVSTFVIYELCKHNGEWYKHLFSYVCNMYNKGVANTVFKAKDMYDEKFRYALLIAECCKNKALPKYQVNNLKEYASLIKISNYNYEECLKALCDTIDKGNKAIMPKRKEIVRKPKKYVIINLNTNVSSVYDSKKEAERVFNESKLLDPSVQYIMTEVIIEGEQNAS